MFGMAEGFYRMHYIEAISPRLSAETKQDIAERISQLTLREPIWLDRDKDWIGDFPELRPYVNTTLSGLYLCALLKAIVEELGHAGNLGKEVK